MGFNLSYLFDHLGLLRTTMDKLLALADEGESGQTVGKLVLVP